MQPKKTNNPFIKKEPTSDNISKDGDKEEVVPDIIELKADFMNKVLQNNELY